MNYCSGGELSSPTKTLFSMSYLYFSRQILCLLIKTLLKYVIMCSMKNVITIS
jgi:hypothetical protein